MQEATGAEVSLPERTASTRHFLVGFVVAGLLLTAVVSGLTFYFFGTMRRAPFGLVDDHEILRFLGADHMVRFSEIPHILLSQTELGQWGSSSRFRPVYYLFRIIEAAIQGDNAGQWYLTRLVLLAVTAVGVGFLVLRVLFVPRLSRVGQLLVVVCALAAGILIVSMPAWRDIATRLGPSEIYVGLGVVLFVHGIYDAWRTPGRTRGWLVLLAGFLVAVGSKEDGVLLLVPLVLIYISRFPSAKHKWVIAVCGVGSVLFAAFIALGALLGASSSGGDIYGNGRSLYGFLKILPNNAYVYAAILTFVVALVCDELAQRSEHDVAYRVSRRNFFRACEQRPYASSAGLLLFMVAGEAFFYQNYFENGDFLYGRYAFLTQFALILACFVTLASVLRLGSRASVPRVILVWVIVLLVLVPPIGGQVLSAFALNRGTATETTAKLAVVSGQIAAGVRELEQHQNSQVVLKVDHPFDYELVFSLPEFLAFYAGTKSVFLAVNIPRLSPTDGSPLPSDPLSLSLGSKLATMAKTGATESGWRVRPANQFDPTKYTVCFYFGAKPDNLQECDSSRQIG